jgi:hypothetical protein
MAGRSTRMTECARRRAATGTCKSCRRMPATRRQAMRMSPYPHPRARRRTMGDDRRTGWRTGWTRRSTVRRRMVLVMMLLSERHIRQGECKRRDDSKRA